MHGMHWWRLSNIFNGIIAMRGLKLLLAGLAIAGVAGAVASDPAPAAPAGGKHQGKLLYEVVNLGDGDLFAMPQMNASGQASFSLQDGMVVSGYFYDGEVLHDIGNLGGEDTYAYDLNDAGQVAGSSFLPGGSEHAFIWSQGGGMLDLGTLPGAGNSEAYALNNLGVVVGMSEGVPGTPPRAFRWSLVDGMENLGAFNPGLGSRSSASALNDAGLIAGVSSTAAVQIHAFAWTQGGGLTDIDTLNSEYSHSEGVSAEGEVIGNYVIPGPGIVYHAFHWSPGAGMVDLGAAGGVGSSAIHVSDSGQVAGVIGMANGDQRAMSWTAGAGMLDLGTFGGARSRATYVNNKGQVVGLATTRKEEERAFVWSKKTGLVDLNHRLHKPPPGLVVTHGLAISDNGAIVARSNAGFVLLRPSAKDGHGPKDVRARGAGQDAHVVGPITAPGLVKVGAALAASLRFVDADRSGTRGVTWTWGDGSSGAGRVREHGGSGSASASHSYGAQGIYRLRATVLDRAGRSAEVGRKIIAYQPLPGTVAGSGVFLSPAGAVRERPFDSDAASFAFVAPPAGKGQAQGVLHFNLPYVALRSTQVRQVAAGERRLRLEGSGRFNGREGYRFTLTAVRGGPAGAGGWSRIGLRIWRTDPDSGRELVEYDNTGGAPGFPTLAPAGPRIAAPGPVGGQFLQGEILRL